MQTSGSRQGIDTTHATETFRQRVLDLEGRRILISRLQGSDQEPDVTAPLNCNGFGRIRHFRMATAPGWPPNPLPIVPACRRLGIAPVPDVLAAQVFQVAACPWPCWYCFVPFDLLKTDLWKSAWFSSDELVDEFRKLDPRPLVLDLSGGSPDLVPEWTAWMMDSLRRVGLAQSTYLWTDDNLSTTYLFDKLDRSELGKIEAFENYGRVCCFKGFDKPSFRFNTGARDEGYERQFQIMRQLLELKIDLYGYVTLTAESEIGIESRIAQFVDRLQMLEPHFPLRVVPLQIQVFGPVAPRLDDARRRSIAIQEAAILCWNRELEERFAPDVRSLAIGAIELGSGP